MNLKDYIKQELKRGRRKFDIPLNEKGEFDLKGLSKVNFDIRKKKRKIKKMTIRQK